MKQNKKNFKLFDSFAFYVPGPGGIGLLCIWFIVGALIGSVASALITLSLGYDAAIDYGTLISYPIMFIPAMIYASLCSKKNSFFGSGVALNSSNFGKAGGAICALAVIVGTFALSFTIDFFSSLLPEPPEWFTDLMDSMTKGNFWINFLCVSILAPVFEEWLCRGEVLRGLLNYNKADGTRGIKPVWAIIVSALFFAVIHGNPWQALPAFAAGCLFGYVYYKTGSLRLTMLMHFTNNTLAIVLSRIPAFKDAVSWKEVLDTPSYWTIFAVCVLVIVVVIKLFAGIEQSSPQGNSDEVTVE